MLGVWPLWAIELAVSLAGLIAAAVYLFHARRSGVASPSCGHCRYDIRGLPTSICPECGSDLTVVGILQPAEASPLTRPHLRLLWTFLMLALSPSLVELTVWLGPHLHVEEQCIVNLSPASGAYRSIGICYYAQSYHQPVPFDCIKCILDGPNQITATLEVDGRTLGYKYPDQHWQPIVRPNGFDTQTVLDWMRTGAVDTTRVDVRGEADELCRMIRKIADGTERNIRPSLFSTTSGMPLRQRAYPLPWTAGAAIAGSILLWTTGLLWLARRRARGQ